MNLTDAEALVRDALANQHDGPVTSEGEGYFRLDICLRDLGNAIGVVSGDLRQAVLRRHSAKLGALVLRFMMDVVE